VISTASRVIAASEIYPQTNVAGTSAEISAKPSSRSLRPLPGVFDKRRRASRERHAVQMRTWCANNMHEAYRKRTLETRIYQFSQWKLETQPTSMPCSPSLPSPSIAHRFAHRSSSCGSAPSWPHVAVSTEKALLAAVGKPGATVAVCRFYCAAKKMR